MSAEQYAATIRTALESAFAEIVGYTDCEGCKSAHEQTGQWWDPLAQRVVTHEEDCPLRPFEDARTALAALLEQQEQRDQRIKELEATASAVARERDKAVQKLAVRDALNSELNNERDECLGLATKMRLERDTALARRDYAEQTKENAMNERALVEEERAVRAERQQAEAEAAYAAELGLRLATERLLDEARELLGKARTYVAGIALRRDWDNWREASVLEIAIDAALARLGAAAPQQEPTTSGDEILGDFVSEETRPL